MKFASKCLQVCEQVPLQGCGAFGRAEPKAPVSLVVACAFHELIVVQAMSFTMPTDIKEPMCTLGFKNGIFECLDGGTALCTSFVCDSVAARRALLICASILI